MCTSIAVVCTIYGGIQWFTRDKIRNPLPNLLAKPPIHNFLCDWNAAETFPGHNHKISSIVWVCVCACISSIVLVIRFDIDKILLITIDSSNAWNSPCVAYASVMNFHIHHAEIFMLFSFRMHISKILRLTIANFPYSLIYLSHSLCPRLAVPLWFNAYVSRL